MHARRPGPGHTCRVAGREYVVEYTADRAGLRDSDDALSRAEIVVLGDSHGMGWGVQGEQSFPKCLQGITGRRVLHASMSSSYGTAREMTLLERLALPAGTLVIQCSAIDLSHALEPGDYYVLDGHMKPSGHEKVARRLAAQLDRGKRLNR